MTTVALTVGDGAVLFECRELVGEERLGHPSRFDVVALSRESVTPDEVLGKPCAIQLENEFGARTVAGIVTRFSALATTDPTAGRRYRIAVRSSLDLGHLRRRTRVYQHKTVLEVMQGLLAEGLYGASAIVVRTTGSYAPRPYLVQYQESDADFVRRLCEEEGLYFRFEARDGVESIHLEDTSSSADAPLAEPLVVLDGAGARVPKVSAWGLTHVLQRRPGKVTLRDYNPETPAVALEGVATGSIAQAEESVEVYEAPGRFTEPSQGATRARLRLESLRADAETRTLETTALALYPGCCVTLERDGSYSGAALADGELFVTQVSHRFVFGGEAHAPVVRAIPKELPFRLPRETRRPHIAGVHTALVTGPEGQEIHTDAAGRVTVHFHWDREGPRDHKSSLPIRVAQANVPGSMATPRVSWEVLVAFEDGDPDRPVVMGRVYNAKQPPPQSLPANKTVMSVGTFSSPGAGTKNELRFDDGAGREHVAIDAGFGLSTNVANNRVAQVVKVEELTVGGSQTITVGANQAVAVTQAYLVDVASQTASVGGSQNIYVKGDIGVSVGSETVMVGGALLEKVGNPVSGALNLAKAAALAGVGQLGVAGMVVSTAAGVGLAIQEGGLKGGAMAGLGVLAGMVPGAEAVVAGVTSPAPPQTWQEAEAAAGAEVAGGGAAAAESDSGAGRGPGPGHRITAISGPYTELIGGTHGVVTPGTIQWTILGAATTLVGASHSTKTLSSNSTTLGVSNETLGSLSIKAATSIVREITGAIDTTIAGALTSKAGGKHTINVGGALTIKVGSNLTFKGANVAFVCGDSVVTSSPGGVLIEAASITITGTTTQSKGSAHE
jgi:type VI secretion system secreted protein VgrG